MKNFIRALGFAVAAGMSIPVAAAHAQLSRGQPQTAFSVADFAKLHWLLGTWEASSPDASTIYQRYTQTSDSTIDIAYFTDPQLTHQTGTGRLYLSVGHVYHTFGADRWSATRLSEEGIFLIPQVSARNTFAWRMQSPDSWTMTQRTGVSGHDRVIVYQMKRIAGS